MCSYEGNDLLNGHEESYRIDRPQEAENKEAGEPVGGASGRDNSGAVHL